MILLSGRQLATGDRRDGKGISRIFVNHSI